jgi:hypothetical protein
VIEVFVELTLIGALFMVGKAANTKVFLIEYYPKPFGD